MFTHAPGILHVHCKSLYTALLQIHSFLWFVKVNYVIFGLNVINM